MPLLVDVRKLAVINEIVRDGATNVAASFGTLAGVDADVEEIREKESLSAHDGDRAF